jgi:pimeloyl-ACP methyl ester carboxylesterase
VLLFNNRGFGVINKVYKDAPRTKKGYKRFYAGAAHEVFTECPDDIQGAINAAKKMGARRIFLAGHSTGCQKSIYWAKKIGKGADGIILLAPISDYSFALKVNTGELEKATRIAKELVHKGKKHQLLPQDVWPRTEDAQRFLSLYTPDSAEEIFTYAQPKKIPRVLRSIEIPILAVFAEHDEFLDRPADDLAEWFTHQMYTGESVVIRNTMHSFQKKEKEVAQLMVRFMKERYN